MECLQDPVTIDMRTDHLCRIMFTVRSDGLTNVSGSGLTTLLVINN